MSNACTPIFGGRDLSGFGDTATFKNGHGLYYIFLFMLYVFFMWLYLFYFICRCLLQERYSNLFIFMQTRYSVHFTIILLCSQNSHCVYIIYIIVFDTCFPITRTIQQNNINRGFGNTPKA